MTEQTKEKQKKKEPYYKDGNQPINMREFNKILDKACKKNKGGKK
jgi:hypothetical protein